MPMRVVGGDDFERRKRRSNLDALSDGASKLTFAECTSRSCNYFVQKSLFSSKSQIMFLCEPLSMSKRKERASSSLPQPKVAPRAVSLSAQRQLQGSGKTSLMQLVEHDFSHNSGTHEENMYRASTGTSFGPVFKPLAATFQFAEESLGDDDVFVDLEEDDVEDGDEDGDEDDDDDDSGDYDSDSTVLSDATTPPPKDGPIRAALGPMAADILAWLVIASRDVLKNITVKHIRMALPGHVLTRIDVNEFVEAVNKVHVSEVPMGDGAFELTHETFSWGVWVVDPLVATVQTKNWVDAEAFVKNFSKVVVLHEYFHLIVQEFFSATYQGIGRADVVLEDIDYAADSFAVSVASCYSLPLGFTPAHAHEQFRLFVAMVTDGMAVFDSGEQRLLNAFPERRLRRYLAWHFYFALVDGLSDWKKCRDAVWEKVSVQLAPIPTSHVSLDVNRVEKVITVPTVNGKEFDGIELFVSARGGLRLFRRSRDAAWGGNQLLSYIVRCKVREARDHFKKVFQEMRKRVIS
jgi:hypothetical protein